MPEEKKPKAEEEEEEEKKTKADEVSPKWALELGAKIDKMTDALLRFAVDKAKEDEKKPKEEEEKAKKPEEEEEKKADKYPKPKEEEEKQKKPEKYPYKEKAEPEKYPYKEEGKAEKKPEEEEEEKAEPDKYPKEEEKFGRMIENAVDAALQKRFTGEAEKRSKVPSDVEETLDYNRIAKMSWEEVEKLAQKLGAPGRR